MGMTDKFALIQYATNGGEYYDMLKLTINRNCDYCAKFGAEMLPGTRSLCEGKRGGWTKLQMIINALEKGFKRIVYLDVDVIIRDLSFNLFDKAELCTTGIGAAIGVANSAIGLTKHDNGINPVHWNTGVMFIESSPEVLEFFKKWNNEPENNNPWMEQLPLQDLAFKYPNLICRVDNKFNAQPGVCPSDEVVIRSFHGMPDRLNLMKEYLKGIE